MAGNKCTATVFARVKPRSKFTGTPSFPNPATRSRSLNEIGRTMLTATGRSSASSMKWN
jgi:hypothetical protein